MPQITVTPATVYAHCRNPRCAGYTQEELKGSREEMAYTFGENGGDGIFITFIEKSTVAFTAELEDLPCPACGEQREITGDPRPQYQPLSGHDPMGLIGGPAFNPNIVNTDQDAQIAELQATVAKLAAMVEGTLTSEDAD